MAVEVEQVSGDAFVQLRVGTARGAAADGEDMLDPRIRQRGVQGAVPEPTRATEEQDVHGAVRVSGCGLRRNPGGSSR